MNVTKDSNYANITFKKFIKINEINLLSSSRENKKLIKINIQFSRGFKYLILRIEVDIKHLMNN